MHRPVVLAVLVGALLVGCSSEAAEPPPLPSVSATAANEASPSQGPSTATVPAPAQEPTPEGASAFARFFYAEVTRGYVEKDPEVVRRLSAPACVACKRFMSSMTALRDAGETSTPVIYNIVSTASPELEGDSARVTVIYDSPEIVSRDRSGAILYTEPEVSGFEEELTLVRGPAGWLVREVAAI